MVTRILQGTVKPGKGEKLAAVLRDEVVPLLRRQPGFLDAICLTAIDDPNGFLSLTFWESFEHVERYHSDHYPKILDVVRPYILAVTEARNYLVEFSTLHQRVVRNAA